MKHLTIFSFLVITIIPAQSQSLLLKKNQRKFYTCDFGKYFDKKEYKIFASPKKYGTFIYAGRPLKATTLLLNLNGKISSSPIDGIFGFAPRTRTVVIDSLPDQTAKFLYNTGKGKVYALPLDKMPCLVPDINSNMPIAKLKMNEYKKMPNALPLQKLIAETEILLNSPERK